MNSKTITLENPITIAGQEIFEITVRRPTVGDEEDAMQQAVKMKRAENPMSVEINLYSKLTGIPYDALRTMDSADYKKIRVAYNKLTDDTENEEDPTKNLTEN